MPRQGRETTRQGTPYSQGGVRGHGQASSRATRRGGCASNSQSTTLSESQSIALTQGDIPALVQEVVQSLTRRSNPIMMTRLARTLHHRAWNPMPQGRPHHRPQSIEVKLLRWTAGLVLKKIPTCN